MLAGELVTPQEWLEKQVPPSFRLGHTMPPLTRFGWTLPFEVRRILAEHWGYALEFGPYVDEVIVRRAFVDRQSNEAKALALARKNPEQYKLSIILSRKMPEHPVPTTWVRDQAGRLVSKGSRIWSPEAPISAIDEAIRLRVRPLEQLARVVVPAVVLNGGEYGVGFPGNAKRYWRGDPNVLRGLGTDDWYTYASRKKAFMESRIAEAVRRVTHGRSLYIYYTAGGGSHRGRNWSWRDWTFDYKAMRGISSFPSSEYYYRHFNEGWLIPRLRLPHHRGDLLTQALNAKGAEISAGDRFSYDWVNGGWLKNKNTHISPDEKSNDDTAELVDEHSGSLSDIYLYEGFLKCLYVAGTVGANAGYYAYPRGGFEKKFRVDRPPHWLQQLTALGRVHAIFTQLEVFVRASSLLPGPYTHAWTQLPAYEIPSGHRNLRALVRKHDTEPAWLLIAWAATGEAIKGRVSLPGLGTVPIVGTAKGSMYLIRGGKGRRKVNQFNAINLKDLVRANADILGH